MIHLNNNLYCPLYTPDAAEKQLPFGHLLCFCGGFFCSFEWLPTDATEGEEDHEVSLLWLTAEARVLQEEVGCCPGKV